MKLALISFAKEDPHTGVPVGLLPLFDGTIAEAQVRIARDLGAERIVFLSPTMHGALLQYVDQLKEKGVDAEIVRNASDLAHYSSDQDELVYIGDGVLPGREIKEIVLTACDEIIFVTMNSDGNSDENSEFERIDLNHRWLGVARLNSDKLSALADIPDDWDIGSALLRMAVQADCRREMISDPALRDGALSSLLNSNAASLFSQKKLQAFRPKPGNFLERLVVWPVTRLLLPSLWKSQDSWRNLGILGSITAIFTAGFAFFEYPLIALVLSVFWSLIGKLRSRIHQFSGKVTKIDILEKFSNFLAIITLMVLVFRQTLGPALVPNLVIAVLLMCSFILLRWTSANDKMTWLKPDNLLIILILLLATIFGGFVMGLYGLALYCTAFLVLQFYKTTDAPSSANKSAE